MLTDEQRKELMNAGVHWPNEVVPFVTDDEYSEYCSNKLQKGLQSVEGIIHAL
jgi:hypothetical protein